MFDWTADEAASFAVLDAFVDAGGKMIDTADVYSAWVPGHKGGESEALIGRWLKRDPAKREKVVIATKVGFMAAGLAPEIDRAPACDASLERLGVDTIDLYYQHKDDENVPLAESPRRVRAPARTGQDPRDRHVQFHRGPGRRSGRDGAALRLHAAGRAPAVVQSWSSASGSRASCATPPSATASASFPYFSLANGFLTGKYRRKADLGKSPRGERSAAYLEGNGMRVLAALDEVAAETGAALATISLAWLMAQPAVTAADRQRDQRRSARGADRGDAPDADASTRSPASTRRARRRCRHKGFQDDRGPLAMTHDIVQTSAADTLPPFDPATFWTEFHHDDVVIEGVRLHFVEGGSGAPILLLPGWPQSWYAWRYVMPLLAKAGRRVIALDPRGMGDSDRPAAGYDMRTVAAELHGFVEALGLTDDGPVDIACHDLGSWIGYSYAAEWPGPREPARRIRSIAARHHAAASGRHSLGGGECEDLAIGLQSAR